MKAKLVGDMFLILLISICVFRLVECEFELQTMTTPFYVNCDEQHITDIQECEIYIRRTLIKYVNDGFYNPSTIPVEDPSDLPLETYVWTTFASINEVSVIEGTFSESVYVDMIWFDVFLTWDPATNCGLTKLWINPDYVYIPDFMLYNAVGEYDKMLSTQDVELYSNGGMWYSRQGQLTFQCSYNLLKFPADTQSCTARFGSFLFPESYLTFNGPLPFMTDDGPVNLTKAVLLPSYHSTAWRVDSVVALETYQELYDDHYSFIYYTTTLTRYPQFYLATAVYPETIVCIIAILGFWVVDISSRLSLSVTALLTTMTVQWSVSSSLPVTKESTWLSIYSIICIVIVALCVAEACCVAYMRLKTGLVPNWVQVLVSLSHNGRRMYRIITCNCGMGAATVKAKRKKSIIEKSQQSRVTMKAKDAFKHNLHTHSPRGSVHPAPAGDSPQHSTHPQMGLFSVAELIHPHQMHTPTPDAMESCQPHVSNKPTIITQPQEAQPQRHVVRFNEDFGEELPVEDAEEDSSLLSSKAPSMKVRSISRLDELVPLFSFSHWNNGKRAIDITWTHGGAALDDCVCVIFPLAYALVIIVMFAQNPGVFGG